MASEKAPKPDAPSVFPRGRFPALVSVLYVSAMPRPRKSARDLDLAATFRPDRHAKRADAPDGGAALTYATAPPAHLSPACAAIWRELVSLVPAGVATVADGAVIETLCHALHAHREAARLVALEGIIGSGSEGQPVAHPALKVQASFAPVILKCCAELGLSPQSRLRLSDVMPTKEPASDPADPWASFAQPVADAVARYRGGKPGRRGDA